MVLEMQTSFHSKKRGNKVDCPSLQPVLIDDTLKYSQGPESATIYKAVVGNLSGFL